MPGSTPQCLESLIPRIPLLSTCGNDDDNDDDNEDENSNGNDLIQVFPAVKQLSSSDLDYNYIFHGDGAVCI